MYPHLLPCHSMTAMVYTTHEAVFLCSKASPRLDRGCSTLLTSFHADQKRAGGSLGQIASLEKASVEKTKLTNPARFDHTQRRVPTTMGARTRRKRNT
jgi:hypothetical protein